MVVLEQHHTYEMLSVTSIDSTLQLYAKWKHRMSYASVKD